MPLKRRGRSCLTNAFLAPMMRKWGLLVRLWKSLEKEINCGRGRKKHHRDCLNNLLRLTLSRAIECDWPMDSTETDMIYSSLERLNMSKYLLKLPGTTIKWFAFMADSAKDKGITTEMLINFMNQDGLDICSRRLEVLRETGYDKVVFNVANYYVKSLRVPSFMASLVDSTHFSDVVNIFVIWITLSFKLKDTGYLYSTLKSVPFSVVYETLHRLRVQLNNSKDESVSNDTSLVKVFDRAYHDVLICAMDDLFTRKKPPGLVSKFGDGVSSLWVEHFQNDITEIKKETDIYVKDSTNSELMYSLGSQLFEKIGKSVLEISLTLIITGIIADLNSHHESAEEIDSKNRRLSRSFILLSKMISHNLTFRRECILTAFSVYPSQKLMDDIISLAKESGFCGTGETNEENTTVDTNSSCVPSVPLRELIDRFDDMSQDLISSLEKGDYNKASGHAFKSIADKKNRNLDGLLLIQGELLTRSANYNPTDIPVKSLTPGELGLDSDLTSDLVSVVNSPRWHLLSWVMEWPQLHEQCLKLLRNPSIKDSVKDLKYLVIDYTQFDDWSSDEEISAMAGVEPGFENWEEVDTNDPEQIDEKGLSKEDEESLSLNKALEGPDDSKRPKIGAPSPEDIQTLINTVPGLLKPEPDLIAPKEPIEMDVRIVQLTRMGPVVNTTSTPVVHLSSSHSASIIEEEPTAEVIVESSSSTESSVDSIANSLISRIQTPVISVPEKQSVIPPRTNIIKIITPNSVNHGSGEIVIKKIQEQTPTPENAMGGDKQVLVHKATGRWIMRQGNRLVTVPPQALGINTTAAASPSPSVSSSSGSHDMEDDDVVEEKEDESITTNTASASVISGTQISKKSTVVSVSPQTLTNPSTSKVTTAHGGVIVHNKAGPSSKPQEDPVTLKRIQQILDDYNEQIRKSPDLQNRPAPRRRTLSTQQSETNLASSPPPTPPVINAMTPEPPPPKQRKVTDSSCNNKLLNEVLESGQFTSGSNVPRAIVRQVVVPSSIAASLQSSKKQLVFLSGNKKIVALKPLIIQQGGVKQAVSLASGVGGSGLKTIIFHQGGVVSNNNNHHHIATTTTNSGLGYAVSCHLDDNKGFKRSLEEDEDDSIHHIGGMHEMLTPPPSSSSLSPTMLSPPSTILDRPSSPPGFGIPMEMTPGQIMEAEISANISDNPYSPLSQCSSSSNRSESF
ncbi:unnamed protein product [Lepeophtheirus salmonis]|uniref:(salmon louse) hypothetical protein n=1 Tax=Lepeophtheirus salmonis TaxID=72036 RepID=A0A7R8CTT3_LEPSM|nr:unnamed protein product [Lepeophtheirus salmonis]CAF2929462.1 unnamed protein product [Lepeophtheirus salmonis]